MHELTRVAGKRDLFIHAETFLPKIGYRKRLHPTTPLIEGLDGTKISSFKANDTKIMFLNGPRTVERKILGATCRDGEVKNNVVLSLIQHVLIPVSELWKDRSAMEELRDVEYELDVGSADRRSFVTADAPVEAVFSVDMGVNSGSKHFRSYGELEGGFRNQEISSYALEAAAIAALNRLLIPIREAYQNNAEWQKIEKLAYN